MRGCPVRSGPEWTKFAFGFKDLEYSRFAERPFRAAPVSREEQRLELADVVRRALVTVLVAGPGSRLVTARRRRDLPRLPARRRGVPGQHGRHLANEVVAPRRRLVLPPRRLERRGLDTERGIHGQAHGRAVQVGADCLRQPHPVVAQGRAGRRHLGNATQAGNG